MDWRDHDQVGLRPDRVEKMLEKIESFPGRTARASGSTLLSDTSAMRRRLGSALAPAPATHSTGMPLRWHADSSDTCGEQAGRWCGALPTLMGA